MIGVRRAALALLGVVATVLGGCQVRSTAGVLSVGMRARVYAAALRDVGGDPSASWVVIDSLIPARDIDADLQAKVLEELPISRRDLDAFLRAQRRPTDRFVAAMLPDVHWQSVSMSRLDSVRAVSRSATDAAPSSAGARRDPFWTQWLRMHPGVNGYVVLSPASLSADGTSALVHVRVACGPTCGVTELRLLQRNADGAWRTTARVTLSES